LALQINIEEGLRLNGPEMMNIPGAELTTDPEAGDY
jgi:hypothetical protein